MNTIQIIDTESRAIVKEVTVPEGSGSAVYLSLRRELDFPRQHMHTTGPNPFLSVDVDPQLFRRTVEVVSRFCAAKGAPGEQRLWFEMSSTAVHAVATDGGTDAGRTCPCSSDPGRLPHPVGTGP